VGRAHPQAARPAAPGHEQFVRTLAFSPDGAVLASGSEDNTGMLLWDAARGARIGAPLVAHPGAEANVHEFIADGSGLLSSSGTEVAVWDLGGVTLGQRITDAHQGRVHGLASTPDGRLLATAGADDGTVRLWDTAGRRPAGPPLRSGVHSVSDVALSPDGRLLALGTFPEPGRGPIQVQLWDTATRRRMAAFESQDQTVPTFSPDGRTVAYHLGGGEVGLWDVTGRRRLEPKLVADSFRDTATAAFSPDGKTLVTGGRDGGVRFWDPVTGRKLAEPAQKHGDMVVGLAFPPDGAVVASASVDGNVFLWDPRSHQVVGAPMAGVSGQLIRVAFSPDGRSLATTNANGGVNLWDVASRQQVGQPLTAHTDQAVGVAFVDGGAVLASGSWDASVIFWDLRASSWEAKACELAGRNLTRDEWRRFVGGDYRRTCPQWPEGRA
jgi:WD40 repeat protein